jgi:MshEN domain
VRPAAPAPPEAPLVAPVVAPASATAPVPAEPSAAMAVSDMGDVPLGTLVLEAGLLPEERLEEALQEGIKTGKRLGDILLERGWVSETDLGRLLAGQKGLPFVELHPSAIDPTAPPLLHPEKARLHGALPVGFEGGVPVVAVADPSNDLVIENVRRALACEPVLVVAGRDALLRAINESYGLAAQRQTVEHVVPQVPEVPEPLLQPVEQQPREGADLWLGLQPEPIEEPAPTPEPPRQVVAPAAPVLHEPQPVVQPEPEAEPVPDAPEPVAAAVSWAVFVRLTDGERLEVGAFTGKDDAFEGARAVVDEIGSDGSWPFLAGRFIRPDSIVSVDLVELEVSRWLGSQARAAALEPDQES